MKLPNIWNHRRIETIENKDGLQQRNDLGKTIEKANAIAITHLFKYIENFTTKISFQIKILIVFLFLLKT